MVFVGFFHIYRYYDVTIKEVQVLESKDFEEDLLRESSGIGSNVYKTACHLTDDSNSCTMLAIWQT